MLNKRRALLIAASLLLTFITLRVYLHLSPTSNLNIGSYNVHHLYTGLLLLTFAGLPLMLHSGNGRVRDVAAIVFGAGLSMALDEVVYLIATDGSDSSYLLPVSLWGGAIMVGLAAAYAVLLVAYGNWRERTATARMIKPRLRPRRADAH